MVRIHDQGRAADGEFVGPYTRQCEVQHPEVASPRMVLRHRWLTSLRSGVSQLGVEFPLTSDLSGIAHPHAVLGHHGRSQSSGAATNAATRVIDWPGPEPVLDASRIVRWMDRRRSTLFVALIFVGLAAEVIVLILTLSGRSDPSLVLPFAVIGLLVIVAAIAVRLVRRRR